MSFIETALAFKSKLRAASPCDYCEGPEHECFRICTSRPMGPTNPAFSRNSKPPPLGGGVFTVLIGTEDRLYNADLARTHLTPSLLAFAACPSVRVTGNARTVWFALSTQSRAHASVRPPPLAACPGSRAADIDSSRPPRQEYVAPVRYRPW
jgi:hypothetical protein